MIFASIALLYGVTSLANMLVGRNPANIDVDTHQELHFSAVHDDEHLKAALVSDEIKRVPHRKKRSGEQGERYVCS